MTQICTPEQPDMSAGTSCPSPLALPDDCGLSGTQQGNAGQSPLPKLPNLAAVQEASHLAELAESELAVTWTGVYTVFVHS